ncbi:MAG: PAS domain S-box protein [Planctomycetaceae bacterium]|nr:PAS domain S-box protein [Planctomycetaceae bacterium]
MSRWNAYYGKTLAALAIVCTGTCVFLFNLFYSEAKNSAIASLNEEQMIHAKVAARGIEDFFGTWTRGLHSLSKMRTIVACDREGLLRMRRFFQNNREDIRAIRRLDERGVVLDEFPFSAQIGVDLSNQWQVRELQTKREPTVSDVIKTADGHDTVAIDVPVFKGLEFKGSIGILVNLEALAHRHLDMIRMGDTGYAWVLNHCGTHVYSPVPGLTGRSARETMMGSESLATMANEMLQGHEGTATYTFDQIRERNVGQMTKYASYTPIRVGSKFWSIAVASAERDVLAGLISFRNRLALVIGALFACIMVFSVLGAKAWVIVKEQEKRRQLQGKLQESEKSVDRFSTLFHAAPFAMALTTYPDGVLYDVNEAWLDLFGFPDREAVVGKLRSDLTALRDMEAREQLVEKCREQGAVRNAEVTFCNNDGPRTLLVNLDPVRIGGVSFILSATQNITERKRVENALRESEERLRLALSAGRLATWDWDIATGNIVWDNEHFRIMGYQVGEVMPSQRAWIERVHPEDQQATELVIARAMSEGGDYKALYRALWPDGAVRWVESRGRVELDARGVAVRCYGVMNDMTERKQAEQAVRESEAKYRRLHQSMRDALVRVDMDGYIQEFNESYCKMLGYDAEELTAIRYVDLTPEKWHPLEAEIVEREVLLKGYSPTYEKEYRRKDGTVFPVEVRMFLIRDDRDQPSAMWALVRDITERKRAEEAVQESEDRLRFALETIHTGAWDLALADHTAVRSLEHDRIFGNAELLPKWTYEMFLDHVLPEDRAAVDERFRRALENHEDWSVECRIRRVDGQIRWIVAAGRHRRDASGAWGRMTGIVQDINERKLAEEAILEAKAAAETASEAKSRFLANMSHELRTPMNSILGMIDVALPKTSDPVVEDCLQTARESADLLLSLLNDLLDSAKLDSGKLELESAPFSVRRMLDQVTRVLSVQARESGLGFHCRVAADTPDMVVGDRMRLQQVLLNLAGNAIKFTERGEVEIGLRVARKASRDTADGFPVRESGSSSLSVTMEFEVRDTGIGISSYAQQRLFQPFSQADASMARRFGGTGLGLSICKNLVEKMGGRIWLESEVGRGSTFHFTVTTPLAEETPADAVAPIAASGPARKLRVLLVDDNPANQKVAGYILQDRGHVVHVAEDGQQAVNLTEKERYDAVLMDVQMPDMNGLQATALIRKREEEGRRMPIIAMTAHALAGDRDRCLDGGMDGYLSKPIDAEEMIRLVEWLAGDG